MTDVAAPFELDSDIDAGEAARLLEESGLAVTTENDDLIIRDGYPLIVISSMPWLRRAVETPRAVKVESSAILEADGRWVARLNLVIERHRFTLELGIGNAMREWVREATTRTFGVTWTPHGSDEKPVDLRVPMTHTRRPASMPPKPGRNELCACGSGLKVKRCHGV